MNRTGEKILGWIAFLFAFLQYGLVWLSTFLVLNDSKYVAAINNFGKTNFKITNLSEVLSQVLPTIHIYFAVIMLLIFIALLACLFMKHARFSGVILILIGYIFTIVTGFSGIISGFLWVITGILLLARRKNTNY